MHYLLARHQPRPLTADEHAIQHAEELLIALEELDALKESLDTSFRAYRQTPTPSAGRELGLMLQQTFIAVSMVRLRRDDRVGTRR